MTHLSVIIPVFNRQTAVARAVDSVLEQDVSDIEIIIVDDGSKPPIALPVKYQSDDRIRLVAHAKNGGAAAARNTGMRSARGAWIAFLDSDDRWLPGTLRPRLDTAIAAAEREANPLLVYVAGFKLIRQGSPRFEVRHPAASRQVVDFASGCWFSPGSTALFLREPLLTRVGGQDERLRRFEDVDWFLRIAQAGGGIVSQPIVAAEIEVGPRPSVEVTQREGALLVAKYRSSMGADKSCRRIVRRLRAWLAFERASAAWHAGRFGETLLALAQSWWLKPRFRLYLEKFTT